VVRFGLPGERGAEARPVALGLWVDGKLMQTIPVETKPSKLVYFDPYSEEQMRVTLSEGEHVFRAAFIDDDFVKGLSAADAYSRKKNKYLDSITFVGIDRKLAASGFPFQSMLFEIVRSLPFQSRRGEPAPNQTLPKAKETAQP
jgi:hypothetical protein